MQHNSPNAHLGEAYVDCHSEPSFPDMWQILAYLACPLLLLALVGAVTWMSTRTITPQIIESVGGRRIVSLDGRKSSI